MRWHLSKYNIMTKIPGEEKAVVVNLFRGTCSVFDPVTCFLLLEAERLQEKNPFFDCFAGRGLIVNFDETSALEFLGRMECGRGGVHLTVCPTMGCNFDCPYCFENHRSGVMSETVQDEVAAFAERMLSVSGTDRFRVTWFGGEPLLAPAVIESLTKSFLALAEKYHAQYDAAIVTNGYLLTKENVDVLNACKVSSAQITLDGLDESHNQTRHLAGGGDTFQQIISNLSDNILPFRVIIRHNIHEGNIGEIPRMKKFIGHLSIKSGNNIAYAPALVYGCEAAEARRSTVRPLCGKKAADEEFLKEQIRLKRGRGHFCGANQLFSTAIDEKGRLYSCLEVVGQTECSYGTCSRWDPADPVLTADAPDLLTCFLNSASPFADQECRECIWLPACAGGCPQKRLKGNKECFFYHNDPAEYSLILYDQLRKMKKPRQC